MDAGLLTALANRAAASQGARTATPGSVGGGSQRGSQQTSQQVLLITLLNHLCWMWRGSACTLGWHCGLCSNFGSSSTGSSSSLTRRNVLNVNQLRTAICALPSLLVSEGRSSTSGGTVGNACTVRDSQLCSLWCVGGCPAHARASSDPRRPVSPGVRGHPGMFWRVGRWRGGGGGDGRSRSGAASECWEHSPCARSSP